MKKRLLVMMIVVTAFLLMACSGEAKPTGSTKQEETGQESKKEDSGGDTLEEAQAEEPVDSVDLEDAASQDQSSSTEDPLSTYPSEKIEYARVWLQVIGNKGVGELNVRLISAGEQLNPYDDNSVDYPEDVIVLSGKITADGIVTYSGNGDGTINVYDVPSHWPSSEQIEGSMEEYTKGIVEDTEQVSVGAGEEDEIIELMGKLNMEG